MRHASLAAAILLVTMGFVLPAVPKAHAQEVSCDPPIDVGLVLDRSGSMSGDPIAAARDGAAELARSLDANDQSGLVSYSSFATLDQALSHDHEATATEAESLTAGGQTATGDAIDRSHDDFLTNARAEADDIMVLLTDGMTNTGSDPVVEAQEAKDDGIEIYAIGLGAGVNEQELREVASQPAEEHFFTPGSTEELLEVFDALAERLDQSSTGEAHAVRAQTAASTGDRVIVDPIAQVTSPPDEASTLVGQPITVGDYTVELDVVEGQSTSTTTADEASAASTSRVSSLEVREGSTTLLSADTLQAQASAQATPTGAQASDEGTRLTGLEVLGESVEATVPPNTVVPVTEDVQLVLNEQITETDERYASLRVNLVHVIAELPDGSSFSLAVSSAFASAECDSPRGISTVPATGLPPAQYNGPDEATSVGDATVNRGGCAEDTVAVSGSGCAEGTVAVSGFGPAHSPLGVAVSGTNGSTAGIGAAVSGFGPAYSTVGAAVSGTGPAYTPLGAAVSGTGDAIGIAAVSGTGNTTGLVLFSLTGECNEMDCYDVQPTDDADAWTLAIAGDGAATTQVGVSVAGTGSADAEVAGAAVSGTGPANSTLGAAASGTNDSEALVALSGTGDTEGTVLLSATGDCNDQACYEVEPGQDASAWTIAVSGTEDSDAVVGVAVSGTGDADTGTGAAISGCTGIQLELILFSASEPSPVPVCAVP